jgi:hypothetical protein
MADRQTTDKKNWVKPELTVLVRNRPEEQVLAACKALLGGQSASNPGSTNNNCIQTLYPPEVPFPAKCGANWCSSALGS